MTWNYRFVKVVTEHGTTVGLYEVFYDGDKPVARTADPVGIDGDTTEEAHAALRAAMKAIEDPVLSDDEIGS